MPMFRKKPIEVEARLFSDIKSGCEIWDWNAMKPVKTEDQPATVDDKRQEELRIQAIGAAISRRGWHAAERAYEAIRDKFYER